MTPIALPLLSITGPPELPGLIGAVTCISRTPLSLHSVPTTPVLKLLANPKGSPITDMGFPTLTESEGPWGIGRCFEAVSSLSNARSDAWSNAIDTGVHTSPFLEVTVIFVACFMTWRQVRIVSPSSKKNPDPAEVPSGPTEFMLTTESRYREYSSVALREACPGFSGDGRWPPRPAMMRIIEISASIILGPRRRPVYRSMFLQLERRSRV